MYVRDARNRDEAWLLEHIEAMGLDAVAFRSRDYVIAVDEESNQRAGFGRYRVHKVEDGEGPDRLCELTGIGVLDGWREQGVGAHVVERLVQEAEDEGFDTVYSLTGHPDYLEQFGFERVDEADLHPVLAERLEQKRAGVTDDAVALELDVDGFVMPTTLRERFKGAAESAGDDEAEPEEKPEDFGIDPDEATYKYDTGRR